MAKRPRGTGWKEEPRHRGQVTSPGWHGRRAAELGGQRRREGCEEVTVCGRPRQAGTQMELGHLGCCLGLLAHLMQMPNIFFTSHSQ